MGHYVKQWLRQDGDILGSPLTYVSPGCCNNLR